jgi:hypothetical protein
MVRKQSHTHTCTTAHAHQYTSSGNIEEYNFVGALLLIGQGELHRVTGIAQTLELNAWRRAHTFHSCET